MESDDIDQIEQAESHPTQPARIKLVPIKQLMKNSQTENSVVQHVVQAEVHRCHTSDIGTINVKAINQNHDGLQSSIDLQATPSLCESGKNAQKTRRYEVKVKNGIDHKKKNSEKRKKYGDVCKSKKSEQLHNCNEISHLPSTSRESVKSSQFLTKAALKSRKHRENIKAHPNSYRKDHSTVRTRAFRARQLFEKLQNAEILPPDPLELSTGEVIHQESQQDTGVQHDVQAEVHQCHTSDMGKINVNAINQNHDRLQSSIDLQATHSLSESGKNAQKTKRYRAKFKNETERKKRISERRKKYREAYKSRKSEQLHNSNEISHLPSTSRESLKSSQCLTKAALKSRKHRENIKAHPNSYRKDHSTERVRAFRTRQLLKKLKNAEILPPDPLELTTGEVIHQESQQDTVVQHDVQAVVHQCHTSDIGEINVNAIDQNHHRLQSSIDLQATLSLSKSAQNAKKKKDYSTERVRAFRTRQFLKKLENSEILPSHPSESGTGEVTHQESQQDNIIAIDSHIELDGIFNDNSFFCLNQI